ncbi:phage tail protein [Undibacterium macrobrachii]|jgi:microcystin-dependent protein|uniref:Microcystin dependent MdpB family protein n=1 Tax=Undibacterium macrobrachii TaxID=1119058 RepID=A0ABQ2XH24_9BURK|nr:tail fiber protein [Undibacterium macrobrachii]GGX16589.1 microcystin dependent MdpB family protein [Undibacterium macrobrachii]
MDAFMGTVLPVAFNYPPRGWMFCNGQIIPIAQNSAMFALLGTMYGGDGQTTFALPDLRGRTIVGSQGQGPGLSNVVQGEKAGTNNTTVIANGTVNITLTLANLPAHNHPATLALDALNATTRVTVGTGTNGGLPAVASNGGLTATAGGPSGAAIYLPAGTAPTSPVDLGGVTTTVTGSGTVTTGNTGTGTPLVAPVVTNATISNMQPYLGLNYIIAMEGIFPSRN